MWFDFGGTPDHVHCVYTKKKFPLVNDMFKDEDPKTIEKMTVNDVTAPVCHMEHVPQYERGFRMLCGYLPIVTAQDAIDALTVQDFLGDTNISRGLAQKVIESEEHWVLDNAGLTDNLVRDASAADLCRLIRNGNINPRHVYDLGYRKFTVEEMSLFTGLQEYTSSICPKLASIANFAETLQKLYLTGYEHYFDTSSISQAVNLELLDLASVEGEIKLGPLAKSLQHICIVRTTLDDEELSQLQNLTYLSLTVCDNVTDIRPVFKGLKILNLDRLNLQHDDIMDSPNLIDLRLSEVNISKINVKWLKHLDLHDCPFITNESLMNIDYVEELELWKMNVSKFGPFAPTIKSLIIIDCPNITDDTLIDVTELLTLQIKDMPTITSISPFFRTIRDIMSWGSGLRESEVKSAPKMEHYHIE